MWKIVRVFPSAAVVLVMLVGMSARLQAAAVEGANHHDRTRVDATQEAMLMKRSEPPTTWPQQLCLDKGYDYETGRETLAA